jgi:hypothetical protein
MVTTDEYCFFAKECLRWADEARNDEQRQLFLDMAKTWTRLAVNKDDRANQDKHPLSFYQPVK